MPTNPPVKSLRTPTFRSLRNFLLPKTPRPTLPWANESLHTRSVTSRPCRVLALINNKGGVGKTTLSVNLAAALAMRYRVLLIDLDPQGSATRAIGRTPSDDILATLTHFFRGTVALDYSIRNTSIGGLDYIAGGLSLVEIETELADAEHRDHRLNQGLAEIKGAYDYVIIDCPPNFGLLARNALVAADGFLAPVQPHFLGMEGLKNLNDLTRRYRSETLPLAPMLGIVLSMMDTRQQNMLTIARNIRQKYGDLVLLTEIPYREKLAEAPMTGRSIFAYEGTSRAAHSFWRLSKEVIARLDRLMVSGSASLNTELA